MNRVIAVSATLATAATATMVAAATIVPAMAAPRPAAAHSVAHAKTTSHAKTSTQARATAQRARLAVPPPTEIGSELDGGQYVTVVHCQGVDSPPPVHLAKPGTPLIVSGVGPSAAILKMLQKPNPYKTIYTCTVVVREKVPAKPKKVAKPKKAHKTGCEIISTGGRKGCTKNVILNTGFGGLAPRVTGHHPAG